MTHLSDRQHAQQMAAMKALDGELPSVGILWDDPADGTLFGMRKRKVPPHDGRRGRRHEIAAYTHEAQHRRVS